MQPGSRSLPIYVPENQAPPNRIVQADAFPVTDPDFNPPRLPSIVAPRPLNNPHPPTLVGINGNLARLPALPGLLTRLPQADHASGHFTPKPATSNNLPRTLEDELKATMNIFERDHIKMKYLRCLQKKLSSLKNFQNRKLSDPALVPDLFLYMGRLLLRVENYKNSRSDQLDDSCEWCGRTENETSEKKRKLKEANTPTSNLPSIPATTAVLNVTHTCMRCRRAGTAISDLRSRLDRAVAIAVEYQKYISGLNETLQSILTGTFGMAEKSLPREMRFWHLERQRFDMRTLDTAAQNPNRTPLAAPGQTPGPGSQPPNGEHVVIVIDDTTPPSATVSNRPLKRRTVE